MAFQQAGVDTQTGLEHIARIGFDCVDVFTEAMTIPNEDIDLIEHTCSKKNLPSPLFPLLRRLSTSTTRFVSFILTVVENSSIYARFKANNLLPFLVNISGNEKSFHPRPNGTGPLKILNYWAITQPIKKLVTLELEPFRLSLLNNLKEMTRFLDDCDHPAIKQISI